MALATGNTTIQFINRDTITKMVKASGLTYLQLESLTGIPHSALQRYVAGTTEKIPMDRMQRLVDVLQKLDQGAPNDQDQEEGEGNMGGDNFKPDVTRNGLDFYVSKKNGIQERYSHRVMNYQLEKIKALCEATGRRPSEIVNELLDYALARAVVKEITRVGLAFEDTPQEEEAPET